MYPNYPACFVVIRKNNSILFVLRENTGYMDGNYSLPAGRVEPGETFLAGAAREAEEEVGLKVRPESLKHIYTQHRYSETGQNTYWVDIFFEADAWEGEPMNKEPKMHSAFEWLPADRLPENIMDFQRQALLRIAEGKSYGEFAWPTK